MNVRLTVYVRDNEVDSRTCCNQVCDLLSTKHRIESTGQSQTHRAHLHTIRTLVALRIIILAGCGVNENNIRQIRDETGVCEFHFSARIPVRSRMQFANPDVFMGAKDADESTLMYTSAERVRTTIGNAMVE